MGTHAARSIFPDLVILAELLDGFHERGRRWLGLAALLTLKVTDDVMGPGRPAS